MKKERKTHNRKKITNEKTQGEWGGKPVGEDHSRPPTPTFSHSNLAGVPIRGTGRDVTPQSKH